MNWQHFVSSAFLNSINFGTLRKLDLGICKPEGEILDPGDFNGVPPPEKALSMPDTYDSMYPVIQYIATAEDQRAHGHCYGEASTGKESRPVGLGTQVKNFEQNSGLVQESFDLD